MTECSVDFYLDVTEPMLVKVCTQMGDDLFWAELDNHAHVQHRCRLTGNDEGDGGCPRPQEAAAQAGNVEGGSVQVVEERIHAFGSAIDVGDIVNPAQWQDIAPVFVVRLGCNLRQ